MVESKLEEEITSIGIIEKYFRNKHALLIYLARKENNGRLTTVIDIIKSFNITKKYAWALLERLEEGRLIEKGEKDNRGGVDYHSYIPTTQARQDLRLFSSNLGTCTGNC
ncbi:MAG: hypothetical protein ACW96X_00320 [Promethearchaeota archaeon]|jgi:DNA-binding MarR family transcriptional regulator